MKIKQLVLEPAAGMPNSRLPLILIEAALPRIDSAERVAAMAHANGWQGTWTYTVFDYWHYHVSGHELLVCVSGEAHIGFGGDDGVAVTMRPGDAAILPAGVGHRRLSGSAHFAVVGAYPPGQDGAITRAGTMSVEAAATAIARLPLPQQDPITGERPGCLAAWTTARG